MPANYTVKIDLLADAQITQAFKQVAAALGMVSAELRKAQSGVRGLDRAVKNMGKGWGEVGRASKKAADEPKTRWQRFLYFVRNANAKTVRALTNDWFRYRYRMRAATRGIITKTGTLAGLGAGAVGGIGRFVVGAGMKAQSDEGGIAVQLMAVSKDLGGKYDRFSAALGEARNLRATFRQLAIASPVGASDISASFSRIMFVASKAGLDLEAQAKLARNLATLDLVGNQMQGTAAGDIRQLLRGSFVAKQIQNPMLRAVGKQIADLAKNGDIKGALALAVKVTGLDEDALKYFGKSAAGQLATIKDKWQQIREVASKPIMKALTGTFQRFMRWYDDHKDQINAAAERFGQAVADWFSAIDWGAVVDSVRDLWRRADEIAQFFGGWVSAIKLFATVWIGLDLVSGFVALVGVLKTTIALLAIGLPRAVVVAKASMAGLNAVAWAVPAAFGAIGSSFAGFAGAAIGALLGVTVMLAGVIAAVWIFRDSLREAFVDFYDTVGQWFGADPLRDNSKDLSIENKDLDQEQRKVAASLWAKNHGVSPEVMKRTIGVEIYAPEELRAHLVKPGGPTHSLNAGTGSTLKAKAEL